MKHLDYAGSFPTDRYPVMLDGQRSVLTFLTKSKDDRNVVECPTGTGKTAIGYTYLRAHQNANASGTGFYLVPNKVLAEQVQKLHPDLRVVYGRNEHPCIFFPEEDLRADEVPCSLLRECPHRVNQGTGETTVPGATPCPYLRQKYEAKQGEIVIATYAFYLYSVFISKEFEVNAAVADEAHGLAKAIRSVLEFHISDQHLEQMILLLSTMQSAWAEPLARFRARMIELIRQKEASKKTLLDAEEIKELLDLVAEVNTKAIEEEVRHAIKEGQIDARKDHKALRQLEVLMRDLRQYMRSFEFSLPTEYRHPLNFTFAFWREEVPKGKRVQHELVVKSYHVAPLIRKMLPEKVLAYSATIGDKDIFRFENGIDGGFTWMPSSFSSKRTRLFMPTDTPDLSVKGRRARDKTKALRMIARAAKSFARKGIRSLVVVISNEEREKFLFLAKEEELEAVSYGNGLSPRECAQHFKEGVGDVLVGTESNYGEGVDLPRKLAPVIFYYRPGYPRPDDPATEFEENRFGGRRWAIWNWRVMMNMLQVRGRNIRSSTDVGVTFLISQQFRRFAYGTLPEWLKPSYVGGKSFEECIKEAQGLLS